MHKQHAESIAKHYFVAEFRKCKDFPTAPDGERRDDYQF